MSPQPRALVHGTADEQQIKSAKRVVKGIREREIADLQQVLSTPSGKRVLWRLLEYCGLYKVSAVFGDPHATYYNEGGRNVGLFLTAEIEEANPGAMLDMVVMAKSEREIEKAERAPETAEDDEDDGN